ncbi:MAG: hypothetical protein QM783_19035 [Phycisphaerales bacterium]
MSTLFIGSSRTRGLCVTFAAVVASAGLAAADIVPTSRSSSTSSTFDGVTQSQTNHDFSPFVSNTGSAQQQTSFTSTSITGYVDAYPAVTWSPTHPHSASASSSFVLQFTVVNATDIAITGDISRWFIVTTFNLAGPGGTVYAPTYQNSGPSGQQTATLDYHGVLAPGSYTLTASSAGDADGAGAPFYGTMHFQINVAPSPGAATLLALAGGLSRRRPRR